MATARNTMRPYSVLFCWDTVRKPSVHQKNIRALMMLRRSSNVSCYLLYHTLVNARQYKHLSSQSIKSCFRAVSGHLLASSRNTTTYNRFFLSLHVWQHVAQMIAVTTCISPQLFLHSLPYPPSFDAAVLYPSLLGGVILSWSARFVGNRDLMK